MTTRRILDAPSAQARAPRSCIVRLVRRSDLLEWTSAAAALIAAALVYYAWRTPALAMFGWAESVGLGGAIAWLRLHAAGIVLPDAVLYSVPDALWQYAFAFVVFRLSSPARGLERALFCAAPIAIGVGLELLQLARLIEGTFDPTDLALGIVAIGIASGVARRDVPVKESSPS
jgi:hypothetical protein